MLKNFLCDFKALDDSGRGRAVFATLDVIDKDRDVTVPGAFGSQTVKLAGAHNWSGPNIGMARISEQGREAIADFRFYLDMPSAKEWYTALKNNFESGVRQEWSYGFDVVDSGNGEFDGQQVRFLKQLRVHEVSPVMVGAGVDTRTLDIKGRKPPVATCEQQFQAVDDSLAEARLFIARLDDLGFIRRKEGKVGRELSRANRQRLGRLLTSLTEVQSDIDKLLRETDLEDDDGKSGLQLAAEYERTLARIRGHLIRS